MSNSEARKSYRKILFYLKRPFPKDRLALRSWLNACSDDARKVTEFYVEQNRKEIQKHGGVVISPGLVAAMRKNFKLEHGYMPDECRKCGCLTNEREKYCSVCGTKVYFDEDLKLLYSLPTYYGNILRSDRKLHKYDNIKQEYIQELEDKYKETHGHAPDLSGRYRCRNCDYELERADKYCQCCGTKVVIDTEAEKIRQLSSRRQIMEQLSSRRKIIKEESFAFEGGTVYGPEPAGNYVCCKCKYQWGDWPYENVKYCPECGSNTIRFVSFGTYLYDDPTGCVESED